MNRRAACRVATAFALVAVSPRAFAQASAGRGAGTAPAATAQPSPPTPPEGNAGAPAAAEGGAGPPAASEGAPAPTPRPVSYGDAGLPPELVPVVHTRRSGVVLGLLLGVGVMQASGTPLKFEQRSGEFFVDTGPSGASFGEFLVGGAFTDWFSFHIGFASAGASHGDLRVSSPEFLFGVETWPLFARGGVWRDLGIGADFGTGGASVKRASDGSFAAESGSASVVRLAFFYDGWRAGSFNFGPFVAYERGDAQTYTQNAGWLGLRSAFYGGP